MSKALATILGSALLTLALSGTALAQPRGPHGPPPPEALEACASQSEGATCSFQLDGRQLSGTCRSMPDGQAALACAPDRPRHDRRPPAEAFQACQSLSAGAACAFTLDGRELSGACSSGPRSDAPLACMPQRPEGPPPEAFEACQSLSEGAACSVSFDGRALTGTCSHGPRSDAPLACMPQRPEGPPPEAD